MQQTKVFKNIIILKRININAGNFMFDTYLQTNDVKSVLCVPIVHQNAIVGILYLENNLLPGAFSQDRVSKMMWLLFINKISVRCK